MRPFAVPYSHKPALIYYNLDCLAHVKNPCNDYTFSKFKSFVRSVPCHKTNTHVKDISVSHNNVLRTQERYRQKSSVKINFWHIKK